MKSPLKKLLALALPVLLVLVAIDLALLAFIRRSNVLEDVVDIQTPATLYAKLDHFRGATGRRIAFVGDSVIYGRRMEEAGDSGWRDHTIPAHTAAALQRRLPDQPVLAMNFAMNGALPGDIEHMVGLLKPLNPDCIVADISLRAFSADFAPDASRLSRGWLAGMEIGPGFRLRTNGTPHESGLERALRDFAISHWRLYQLRDFVQWRILGGEPASAVRSLRSWLDARLRSAPPSDADPMAELLLTLKAKNRHDSVKLEVANPQLASLKRTLDGLAADNQCAVFFYATEDAQQLPDLIDLPRYRTLQAQLAEIFAPYADRGISYLPPLGMLKPQHYLDYGHLNDAGNAIVAAAIVDYGLAAALQRSSKPP